MTYDENGNQIMKSFEANSINEISNSFNDLRIVLEKETIAKQIDSYRSDATVGTNPLQYKTSILNGDVFSARQHSLNQFDEKKAKLILESEDICKEYEAWALLDFYENIDKTQNAESMPSTGVELNMYHLFNSLTAMGLNKNDIRKYLLQQYYNVSDDPEVIKKMLHLRLNYNKKMTSLYQKMLELNYKVLNITKEEAEGLSKDADVNKIREIVLNNEQKFVKRDGTFYDLRELGFGVAFLQEGITGLEDFTTLEHFLNLLMRYDVVFLTHGKYNSHTLRNMVSKKYWEEIKFFNEYQKKIASLVSKYGYFASLESYSKEDQEEVNRLNELMIKKYNIGRNDPMLGPTGVKSKWTCMPIRTELGGPYTDVVKLIQQCITEARANKKNYNMIGSKNNVHIMVLCCNPGAISLPKSITSQKDVHIHYGKSSVLAENSLYESYNDNSYNEIDSCEKQLIEFCNYIGIDYNDDQFLNECYNSVIESDVDLLIEMSVKELWNSAVALAKKIWGAIVAAFKWVIGFFRDIIRKIKIAIQDKLKDSEVKNASFISMESARVKKVSNQSIGQIQYAIEKSCNNIAKNINKLQQTQTSIMKKIDDELNKKAREFN